MLNEAADGELHLDKRARLFLVLAAVFVTCLIVGDIVGGKLVTLPLFGHDFTMTVGMIPFPVTFVLTDLLNEFYGKRAARTVTLVGFGMALLAFTFIFIAGAIPIAEFTRAADWTGVDERSFNTVFLGSQRMIVASMCAYLVAQYTDIGVFHALKRLTGSRMLWLRATGSTTMSQLIDTVVINSVAWAGVLSGGEILNIIVTSYVLKVLIAIGLTPVIYAGHTAVERLLGMRAIKVGRDGKPLLEAPSESGSSAG